MHPLWTIWGNRPEYRGNRPEHGQNCLALSYSHFHDKMKSESIDVFMLLQINTTNVHIVPTNYGTQKMRLIYEYP